MVFRFKPVIDEAKREVLLLRGFDSQSESVPFAQDDKE
jgi:hypothetical protein